MKPSKTLRWNGFPTRRPRRPPRPAGRPAQRGVALIEALVSMLIFSFGLLGLLGLEASAINLSVAAEDRNRAALFANEIASTMWVNGTVTVSSSQLTTWQTAIANTAATGLPGGTVAINPTSASNSADIVITWTPVTDQTSTTRQLTTRVILP